MKRLSSAISPRDGSLLGRAFAHALARQDFDQIGALLDDEIDFCALTPRQTWTAGGVDQTLEVLRTWFPAVRVVEGILGLEVDAFADLRRVGYRFRVRMPEGPFLIEQQAYFNERDGRIDWMRLVCSGFRAAAYHPAASADAGPAG